VCARSPALTSAFRRSSCFDLAIARRRRARRAARDSAPSLTTGFAQGASAKASPPSSPGPFFRPESVCSP
jgi:hypothetical protein